MKYRSDIDGLRAVAVIPVILFHAGFSTFSGGFVGVDVFFVISGFLITKIILSDMESGTFSLLDFYERRARRILPALFLVMLVSLVFSWFWLLPNDMKSFSQSLVATSTFSSNIYFWLTSGYWDSASELKPLLHTWSLAVEEQYYLVFPVFLILMWKYRKRWIFGSFILISGVSFAVAQWGAYHEPTATFYLLLTRAWELAIGASIAFFSIYRKGAVQIFSHGLMNEVLGLFGLLMIGYGVFVFDEGVPFPSLYALVPTIGAGLIIVFSSPKTMVGKLLSSKPLVAVGLTSYSAYLWHQPLFAFARYRFVEDNSRIIFSTIAVASFFLAYLTWKYVEKPFRNKNKFRRNNIFLFSLIGSIVFVVFGLSGYLTNGFYKYIPDNGGKFQSFIEYDRRDAYREGVCFLEPGQEYSSFKDECFSSAEKGERFFLWGDSHAAALSYGLRKEVRNLTQLTASGCLPLVGYNPAKRPNCVGINNYVLSEIERLKPEFLVIHANWSDPLSRVNGGLKDGLLRTVLYVKSESPTTKIFMVGGVPQWLPSLPYFLLKRGIELDEMAYLYSQSYKDIREADDALARVAKESGVIFISLLDFFCENEKCQSSVKFEDVYEPFVWDRAHLTRASSILVANKILPTLLDKE